MVSADDSLSSYFAEYESPEQIYSDHKYLACWSADGSLYMTLVRRELMTELILLYPAAIEGNRSMIVQQVMCDQRETIMKSWWCYQITKAWRPHAYNRRIPSLTSCAFPTRAGLRKIADTTRYFDLRNNETTTVRITNTPRSRVSIDARECRWKAAWVSVVIAECNCVSESETSTLGISVIY